MTRDGACELWLLFRLQAVAETSRWTTRKISVIRKLVEHTSEHVRTRLPKIYTRELVDVIFEQPYCRISNLVDKGIAQRQAASRYLHDLAGLGVLREMPLRPTSPPRRLPPVNRIELPRDPRTLLAAQKCCERRHFLRPPRTPQRHVLAQQPVPGAIGAGDVVQA